MHHVPVREGRQARAVRDMHAGVEVGVVLQGEEVRTFPDGTEAPHSGRGKLLAASHVGSAGWGAARRHRRPR